MTPCTQTQRKVYYTYKVMHSNTSLSSCQSLRIFRHLSVNYMFSFFLWQGEMHNLCKVKPNKTLMKSSLWISGTPGRSTAALLAISPNRNMVSQIPTCMYEGPHLFLILNQEGARECRYEHTCKHEKGLRFNTSIHSPLPLN